MYGDLMKKSAANVMERRSNDFDTKSGYTLHNVRFYDFEPKAIQCMSYENETNRLALSRADGSIEIWNCQNKPFLQQVLPGDDDSSVEGVAWCDGRLFSAGLHGFILEHNLATGEVLSRTAVTGGPAWCLALSPDKCKLAVGTEEGYTCLFNIVDSGVLYDKHLDKQEGRILHLGWHYSSDYIVTGSINCVQLKSLKDNRIMRCSIAHSEGEQIIVWCVTILDDMTIVSGDSRGMTCFWNGMLGVVIFCTKTHTADVLSLTVCPSQNAVYVAGVDPNIVCVRRILTEGPSRTRERWCRSNILRLHTHDVRAITIDSSGRMYSGGVDTMMALSYYPPLTIYRFRAQPPRGSVCVAQAASCVLLKYRDHLQLWRLGSTSSSQPISSQHFLPITKDRVKLLELRSRTGEVINWCALSSEACWIVYIVNRTLRIFQFYQPTSENQVSVRRVREVSKAVMPSHQAVWLGEARLASATTTSLIQIITVSEYEANVASELSLKPGRNVVQMTANPDGSYLVVVDDKNQVTAFCLESSDHTVTTESENSIPLPLYDSPVTAVGIHPASQDVVVAYANMMIKEFSLVKRHYTNFSQQSLSTPSPDLVKRSSVIKNISFDECNSSLIFLHDDEAIIVLDKNKDTSNEYQKNPTKKQRALNYPDASNSSSSSVKVEKTGAFSIVRRSNQVIHFSYIKNEEVVSVELNPLQLLDKLPPTLKVKKFGAG